MRTEIDQLRSDVGRMGNTVVTEMTEALLESKFDVILDHVDET